jgi:hypothetical protein
VGDHAHVLAERAAVFASALVALSLGGLDSASAGHLTRSGTATPLRSPLAGTSEPPTPADFIGYPSCMIYATGADTRIRVRAARAAAFCVALSRRLSSRGVRWSPRPGRLRRVLSPICRFADPRGRIELEVMDDAVNSSRGQHICRYLARAGWLDLGSSGSG